MTQNSKKTKYEQQLSGSQVIESSLHKDMIEHVNAEVTLKTFFNGETMLTWVQSTFLYIRLFKNPGYYGVSPTADMQEVHAWLEELCTQSLRLLKEEELISGGGSGFQSTLKGVLMARYYIFFATVRLFRQLTGTEDVEDLITLLSEAREFSDVQLRVTEKTTLNLLNRNKAGPTIRFPLPGKIKTTPMKVIVLIQATLGALPLTDHALSMDVHKVFRAAVRVVSCLLAWIRSGKLGFLVTMSALVLGKCLEAKMWWDSEHVTRQLLKIGPAMSGALVAAGYTSFQKVMEAHPRQLEAIVNRRPPFGNQLVDAVSKLPNYSVSVIQSSAPAASTVELVVTVELENHDLLIFKPTAGPSHTVRLLIGDADNKIQADEKIRDSMLTSAGGIWTKLFKVNRADGDDLLRVELISETLIGLDVKSTFTPAYTGKPRPVTASSFALDKKKKAPHQYKQTELKFPAKRKAPSPIAGNTQYLEILSAKNTAVPQNSVPLRPLVPVMASRPPSMNVRTPGNSTVRTDNVLRPNIPFRPTLPAPRPVVQAPVRPLQSFSVQPVRRFPVAPTMSVRPPNTVNLSNARSPNAPARIFPAPGTAAGPTRNPFISQCPPLKSTSFGTSTSAPDCSPYFS